jgi:hypothetical protein
LNDEESTESGQQARMTFAVRVALSGARTLGGVAFGAALLGVVPAAERLQVVEVVGAAR